MCRIRWLPLAICIDLIVCAGWSAASENAMHAARESITAAEARDHVNFLADDTLEGRASGSRGGRAAGGYLAEQFRKAGLTPSGEGGSYFQAFGGASRNVLGMIEGSDSELKNQIIVVGAHYDHVGYGNARNSYGPFGYIHNGADDNASGVSAILELVDAYKRLPQPPKRSILFASWDGEEQGLLGSQHFVAHPTVPLSRIVFLVNVDMIGRLRNHHIELLGSRSAQGLRQFFSRQNREFGLDVDFTWELQSNSDHYPFYARSIPILMPFTGFHEDYHRPSDDADKINVAGIEEITRLLFNVTYALADEGSPGAFRVASRRETPYGRQQLESTVAPPAPRLGMTWETVDNVMQVSRTVAGLPAARAGLRIGDRILQLDGEPIGSDEEFRLRILAAANPVTLTVERKGEDKPSEVSIKLDGSPVRIGLSWREDDAEPGTVMITQVVPGSAANLAGVKEKDRVYEVNDQSFKTADAFREMITNTASPINMLLERNGKVLPVVLHTSPTR